MLGNIHGRLVKCYVPSHEMTGCIDVIIPTWNEELWLPRLLDCLKGSKIVRAVIVADNDSEDNTRTIAEAYGSCVVQGGRPARARNAGASQASADILLFVDADTVLPIGFLDGLIELFHDRSLVAVYFRNLPLSSRKSTYLLARLIDWYIRLVGFFGITQGMGTCIGVRAKAFETSGGFSESIEVGEDAYFLRSLSKIGNVKYVRNLPVYTSSRRLRLDGTQIYLAKLLFWTTLRLLNLKGSVFKYNWRRYPSEFATLEDDILV
jgi:glycosyltransferase involved in cell wall biosynthesis